MTQMKREKKKAKPLMDDDMCPKNYMLGGMNEDLNDGMGFL